jgi:single-strand DNA-binding protein
MRKGRELLIEGRLRLDTWDDKQTGQKRSKLGVILESFSFIGGGNRTEGAPSPGPARPAAAAPSAAPAAAAADAPPVEEDDVPF